MAAIVDEEQYTGCGSCEDGVNRGLQRGPQPVLRVQRRLRLSPRAG